MLSPIILSGGSGQRLWPASRTLLPKQFLPFLSERTLLQQTTLRLQGLNAVRPPLVVCNSEHRFLAAEQLAAIELQADCFILEPVGRNTAPALAVAALQVVEQAGDGVMLVLPSDHYIRDVPAFQAAVTQAAALAGAGKLVTFGIVPDSPETGYGYIKLGSNLPNTQSAHVVAEFVEKPNAERARQYVASGDYAWNSGMFAFSATRYLEELGKFRPDILAAATAAWRGGKRDARFLHLNAEAFNACPSESIDYAVMEKTQAAVVIPIDVGWSDIGSWSSLWQVSDKDEAGNAVSGDVFTRDASNCYVRAESRMVAAIGVNDVVVVETSDAILVTHKDSAQQVKHAVEHLKSNKREEHHAHRRVFRPWGYYEQLDKADGFQVKRIMVKPGQKLSLQMHHHRAEHWVVVAGKARITLNEEVFDLGPNQSTFIPIGAKHRLENIGTDPLLLIEVQCGSYLGEDDIVRFEDVYRRV